MSALGRLIQLTLELLIIPYLDLFPNHQQDIFQLLDNWDYSYEIHHVKTPDNYILEMHRILGPKYIKTGIKQSKKPVVLLMHGLQCSSTDWVVMGPDTSLGLLLADAGYDVWLGNNRGNTFSMNNSYLSPNDPEFWDYSYNEIGMYDVPSMIDKVLNETKREKLSYVGYSEGMTSIFVALSVRPEYNKKINVINALAPVTNMYRIRNALINFVAFNPTVVKLFQEVFHPTVLARHNGVIAGIVRVVCGRYGVYEIFLSPLKTLCFELYHIIGASSEHIDKNHLYRASWNFPAGMSWKQVLHYAQGTESGVFARFNYGADNFNIYGSVSPPVYNLSLVKVPMYVHYGEIDCFINITILRDAVFPQLNIKKTFYYSGFDHLDFIWGKNMQLLNQRSLDILNKVNRYKSS